MSHGDALPRPPLHSWLFYVFDGIFLSGRVGLEREPSALWWRYAPHSFLSQKKWKRRERFEKNGREWRWNECVKANGGREKTECASITGSKDYSCHFHWILFSHSLFSSYIFFSFFFLLSPMGIHFRLYHSWLRWIYLLPWNILVYGRPITALYTVLHIRGFRQVHEMNMVMQFASRKWNGRSLLDIHKDIKRERNVEREKKWWRKWM